MGGTKTETAAVPETRRIRRAGLGSGVDGQTVCAPFMGGIGYSRGRKCCLMAPPFANLISESGSV